MKDYGKALEFVQPGVAFAGYRLAKQESLQSRQHALSARRYAEKDDEKLKDWTNALQHYEQTLKIKPENKEAKENLEYVKRKIEELKKKQEQQPTPTPSPSPKPNKDEKKQDKQEDQQKNQEKKSQDQKQKQEKQDQKDQQKDNAGKGDQQKPRRERINRRQG